MAEQIIWNNTKEHNPFLAKQIKVVLDPSIDELVTASIQTSKTNISTDITIKPLLSLQDTIDLSSTIVSPEATAIPQIFSPLYIPGPQGETFLLWGQQHIVFIDGSAVYLSIWPVPQGEVVYHTVPAGKVATIQRVQCTNTLDKQVTISFFIGTDPFQNPRVRSDVLINPNQDYDLSCVTDAFEGESLGMIVSDGDVIHVAISGHLNDVVVP